MNNRDAIEYLKEKNNQALNNKNLLLEKYRENGQDVFEKADPLYLKKIGVTYPTTGDINDEDIAEYRNELSELIGEFITSTATVKELINDMDDDEVQDLLVNWENVYKKIFESLEGQMIDYKKLRLTINKKLTERMYLERQSVKLKEEMGNKNPITNATVGEIVNKLPNDIRVQNNEYELMSVYHKTLKTIQILGENDTSVAKLTENLYKNRNDTSLINTVSNYINSLIEFNRQEKITDIKLMYNDVVYVNGLLPEFKKLCKDNNITPPINAGSNIMLKKLTQLPNDSIEVIFDFVTNIAPTLINERRIRDEKEEEDRKRREEDRKRREEEENIRKGDELIAQLQNPQEVAEGPGEKGEPDKNKRVVITDEDISRYGKDADDLIYKHWSKLPTNAKKSTPDKHRKYNDHRTRDVYEKKLKKVIRGLKSGLTEEEIFNILNNKKQDEATKKEEVPIVNTGSGLRSKLKPHQKAIKDKYYIDLKKLNANILEIRYTANKHLTGIKSQRISSNVREIILSMADGMFDEDLFKKVTKSEQNLIRNIARLFKIDIDDDGDDEFDREFEILIGQYESGNDSELLRKKIKSYISHGMKIGRITRKHGYDMLLEMSL